MFNCILIYCADRLLVLQQVHQTHDYSIFCQRVIELFKWVHSKELEITKKKETYQRFQSSTNCQVHHQPAVFLSVESIIQKPILITIHVLINYSNRVGSDEGITWSFLFQSKLMTSRIYLDVYRLVCSKICRAHTTSWGLTTRCHSDRSAWFIGVDKNRRLYLKNDRVWTLN